MAHIIISLEEPATECFAPVSAQNHVLSVGRILVDSNE